ncbi:hypothetical protein B0H12DRAFT_297897 [Mycena haematopus]|nr:hypothetical protein B0H12DRAFT_297897 [Mycena haematopus]
MRGSEDRGQTPQSAPSTSSRPSTSDLITQSPTTDRIVKKGRVEPDVPAGAGPSPPPSTPTTPTPVRPTPRSSDPVPPGPRPGFPSSSICPVTQWPECRKKVVNGAYDRRQPPRYLQIIWGAQAYGRLRPQRLTTTLRRDIAPQADGRRVASGLLPVYRLACYCRQYTPTPPPTAPVEADTTKPTHTYAAKVATPPPAPAKPTMKPPTTKPQQKPRLPDKASPPPTTSRSAPQRLILRFANSSVIKSVADPQSLRDSLNVALKGASKLKAVNRSPGGNLVLHTQAPYTAVQLREHEQTIWGTIRPYFSLQDRDRPRFNLDKPWQPIVIHRVPVTTASSNRSLVEELRWSNDGIGALSDVMGVRDLCSLDGLQKRREGLRQGVPQETSLMFMLSNTNVARRFLREGVLLYGSHCRVSAYDPRVEEGALGMIPPNFLSYSSALSFSTCFSTPPTFYRHLLLPQLYYTNLCLIPFRVTSTS